MDCFIENVSVLMEEQGVSQSELARRTGISVTNINRILHGKERVTIDRAERIADALGKQLFEFLKIPA